MKSVGKIIYEKKSASSVNWKSAAKGKAKSA